MTVLFGVALYAIRLHAESAKWPMMCRRRRQASPGRATPLVVRQHPLTIFRFLAVKLGKSSSLAATVWAKPAAYLY